MPSPAPQEDAGEVFASPASNGAQSAQTFTDGIPSKYGASFEEAKARFNHGRHRWLGQVARDDELPGAAVRVAVLLWELMRFERECAWPSLVYIAEQLRIDKSTEARSIGTLRRRRWIKRKKRGGRHRSNEYRMAWSTMDDDADQPEFPRGTRARDRNSGSQMST